MRKTEGTSSSRVRVLARALAVEELTEISGAGPDTVWTKGPARPDITQLSQGDTADDPPAE